MKDLLHHSQTIRLNYNDQSLPENVRRIQPAMWKEGELYCVLSGPNSQHGILGFGATLETAMLDWNRQIAERRSYGEYIRALLPSNNKIIKVA